MRGCGRVSVHIDLSDLHPLSIVACQFIQNRFEPAAVASPGCGEVNEHRSPEGHDLLLESGIGDLNWSVGIEARKVERFLAFPALEPISPSAPGNTVLRPALGTDGDY